MKTVLSKKIYPGTHRDKYTNTEKVSGVQKQNVSTYFSLEEIHGKAWYDW